MELFLVLKNYALSDDYGAAAIVVRASNKEEVKGFIAEQFPTERNIHDDEIIPIPDKGEKGVLLAESILE